MLIKGILIFRLILVQFILRGWLKRRDIFIRLKERTLYCLLFSIKWNGSVSIEYLLGSIRKILVLCHYLYRLWWNKIWSRFILFWTMKFDPFILLLIQSLSNSINFANMDLWWILDIVYTMIGYSSLWSNQL